MAIAAAHAAAHGQGGGKKNLNMMSAFTHIIGDTLRTFAMFAAALVATLTGIDGDICDAYAALVVTFTIVILCTSLVLDIWAAATDIWYDEYVEVDSSSGVSEGGGVGGARNARKYASITTSRSSGGGRRYDGAYRRVSGDDEEEGEEGSGIELR